MTSDPQPASPEVLPDLMDLDDLLKDVQPLSSPHDWAAPELFPDDAEFDEFLSWLRTERSGLA
jgi:hypothetical protein